MKIESFALERYFARHEFSARYLLSSSDCEALSMNTLLEMADSESLALWQNLKFSYTETFGHPALREAIADIYPILTADNVLVTAPEEGIFLAMQTLLEPEDHVICTYPGYQSLYALARSIGCDVSLWECNEDRGWHFDLQHLDQMMRPDTKMVVVNFPHNPTGFIPTHEEYETLIDIVGQSSAYLFSDEMYRFLELDLRPPLPAACELYAKAISLCGLSKTFGLPGLRIGWLVAQDDGILDRMSLLRDYTTICNSAPSEILGLMALRNRSEIISLQQSRIRRNMQHLDDFFSAHQDSFVWNRPLAGSICFPRMTKIDDTLDFCEKLVAETGIMLVPSALFRYGQHHIRIGYGRDNFPEVIGYFADYLDR